MGRVSIQRLGCCRRRHRMDLSINGHHYATHRNHGSSLLAVADVIEIVPLLLTPTRCAGRSARSPIGECYHTSFRTANREQEWVV